MHGVRVPMLLACYAGKPIMTLLCLAQCLASSPHCSGMRLSQGVICYESIMEEARRRGLVHKGSPIMCKPNPLVRPPRPLRVLPCSLAACHTAYNQMAARCI